MRNARCPECRQEVQKRPGAPNLWRVVGVSVRSARQHKLRLELGGCNSHGAAEWIGSGNASRALLECNPD